MLCSWEAAMPLSVLLAAAVRTSRPPAVAGRGLGGNERREHGDDAQHWGGLRQLDPPVAATKRWESSTSRSFPTWITRLCWTTPWPTPKNGPRACRCQAYAIDDQTALKVVDGAIDVISEGHWKRFTHESRLRRPGVARDPARLKRWRLGSRRLTLMGSGPHGCAKRTHAGPNVETMHGRGWISTGRAPSE